MYIIVILFKDDLEAFVGTSESVSSLEVRIRLYFIYIYMHFVVASDY